MRRKIAGIVLVLGCVAAFLSQASAQPAGKKDGDSGKKKSKDYSKSSIVTKMMAFDKNKDGKLTKDEVTDPRLHRLFDRADKNKDGVVTKEELMALAAELEEESAGNDQGGKGRGPGGPGRGADYEGPGDRGPGGPGGRGPGGRGPGGFGPPQPGQILPTFLQDRLKLTAAQKKELAALQKQVDAKLAKILTDEQKKQLKEMRDRGPGGRGPGGPGGRGPGGPPPDED
jgi:hypothetical protein